MLPLPPACPSLTLLCMIRCHRCQYFYFYNITVAIIVVHFGFLGLPPPSAAAAKRKQRLADATSSSLGRTNGCIRRETVAHLGGREVSQVDRAEHRLAYGAKT